MIAASHQSPVPGCAGVLPTGGLGQYSEPAGANDRCAVAVIVVMNLMMAACGATGSDWTPESKPLLDGTIQVESGKDWTAPFEVDENMRNVVIRGEFHVKGGSGNDIKAAVAEQNQYENWVNSHAANVAYDSGQKTFDNFEVKLPPGRYVLGFSNRFSTFSDKSVTGKVILSYDKRSHR